MEARLVAFSPRVKDESSCWFGPLYMPTNKPRGTILLAGASGALVKVMGTFIGKSHSESDQIWCLSDCRLQLACKVSLFIRSV